MSAAPRPRYSANEASCPGSIFLPHCSRSLGGVPPPARPPTPRPGILPRINFPTTLQPLSRRRSPSGEATHPQKRNHLPLNDRFFHNPTGARATSVAHKKSFVDNRARLPALATLTVAAGSKAPVDLWKKLRGKGGRETVLNFKSLFIGQSVMPTIPQVLALIRLPTKSLLWTTERDCRLLRLLRSRPAARHLWICGHDSQVAEKLW